MKHSTAKGPIVADLVANAAVSQLCAVCGCPEADHPGKLMIGPCQSYRPLSSIRQEIADRDELGSLVGWLRGRTSDAPIPEGCAEPWLASLERILDHIDRRPMRYGSR